jgi:hypothetical protein
MVNIGLFRSSIVCTFFHIALIPKLETFHLLGLATSILNHGTTSRIAQFTDRISMIIGISNDIYTADIISISLITAASLAYFKAKSSENDKYHIMAHACVTLSHIYKYIF